MFDYFVYCGWIEPSMKGYREVPGSKGVEGVRAEVVAGRHSGEPWGGRT